MTLTPGSRVGAFEIRGVLGRGGMGEVYRAQDMRLGREVAIKILPEGVSSDADRGARFQLEARVLATLNHPNVGAIYGLEESGDLRALVLELVEGPTLEDRIAQARGSGSKPRGLPLDEVFSIGQQIAVAVEAAHEQGIVHRDLKPANVKVRPDGTVKVLDFGLAKLSSSGPMQLATGGEESPTLTSPSLLTQHGVILGTAAYMSPEQARGKVADKRSDVWSFGCVLYEMLTGQRAFPGDDVTDTLAAVVRAEPDWSALPPSTPAPLRRLLERALRKDPKQRLPDIGSARLEIADAASASSEPTALDSRAATPHRRGWIAVGAGVVAAALLGAAAATFLRQSPGAPQPEPLHVEITTLPTIDPVGFAISPDGRQLVFVGSSSHRSQLWLRALATGEVRALRETDGASYPFWAPDGRSIGFFAGNAMRRLDLDSESVRTLAWAPVGVGGTWNRDGTIVYSPAADSPLVRVPADGGDFTPLADQRQTTLGERCPRFLPDGRSFLYFKPEGAHGAVYLGTLESTERIKLVDADGGAVYANGELLYGRGGTLWAQPFDLEGRRVVGSLSALAEGLAIDARGVPALSVSNDGTLIYRTGAGQRQRRLVWVDRSGAESGAPYDVDLANARNPALSPDGRRVAMNRMVDGNTDVWLFELERRLFRRFTFGPGPDLVPLWSPDGKRLLYSVGGGTEGFVLTEKLVDGIGDEEPIAGLDAPRGIVTDLSINGFVLSGTDRRFDQRDVYAVPLDGGKRIAVATTSFVEVPGEFSPDGRWVTYMSNESGRSDVFVQSFPDPAQRLLVSSGGGVHPRFSPHGGEIFYLAADSRLMAVTLRRRADATLDADAPVPLFTAPLSGTQEGGNFGEYVVAGDGNRFLLNALIEQTSAPLQLVLDRPSAAGPSNATAR